MKKIEEKNSNREIKNLKSNTLLVCTLLIIFFAILMCIINIVIDNKATLFSTTVFIIWYSLNVIIYFIFKKQTQLVAAMAVGAYAIMLSFVIDGGIDGFSVIWILTIPYAIQYCFNTMFSILFNIFLGASLAIYFWTPLQEYGYQYSEVFRLRFPLVYFLVTLLSAATQYRISKYLQKQEELMEQLESASQAKNDFLANMSHEIRTPMNTIVGMSEMILREDISEDARENCYNIQNASRSLLSIINDILDFSKIEAGKIELIEEPFNISSIINDAINMAMTRKGDKDIDIIVRLDPEIPKGLIGDEMRIRQVIINLLTNAVKFTNEGCVLLKVTQSSHDYGINLNVSVKDTGIGITEENIEKLFTSFQQVDTKKNRAVEGTGLGLAISKRLITSMHGFMNVSSTYGEGSEFKFVIPLKVSDSTPCIQIKSAELVNVAIFLNWRKYKHRLIIKEYRKLILELGSKLNVSFTIFDNIEKLKDGLRSNKFTHCFTAKEEYEKYESAFPKLTDYCELIVVQDRFHPVELPNTIKKVYKPFYALTFAAVLNREKYGLDTNVPKPNLTPFIAPDAKILVVDDNHTNLKVSAGLMKPYNMNITTASSGKKAIEALQSKEFHLVFMDHMMPELDGVETTKLIRNMPDQYYRDLPIIALTANDVNGARELFLQNGFQDFVSKPIELSILDKVLRTWLPKNLLITTSTITTAGTIAGDSTTQNKTVQDVTKSDTSTQDTDTCLIHFPTGLMYCGNSTEIYYEILNVYIQSSRAYWEYLITAYQANDWKKYTIDVHALKSSSLSIGATTFAELAKKLEFAGKEGTYDIIHAEHEHLLTLYAQVIEEATAYLRKNSALIEEHVLTEETELTELTFETFTEKVNAVIDACENFDGDTAITIAKELCACKINEMALATYFEQVVTNVDDYNYDQAIALCKQTLESLSHDIGGTA